MTTDTEIEEAIENAKKGDQGAIVLLFRTFNPQLLRYLKHHTPNDFEDVASETWLSIAKGIQSFTGDARDFRAWMFGVARNKLTDYYRTQGKARQALEKVRSHLSTIPQPNFGDSASTPALSNISSEAAIEILIGKLPAHHAEVLLLRIVADLSVEEVAKIVGKSPEAVRVIQHRAVKKLVKTFNRNDVT